MINFTESSSESCRAIAVIVGSKKTDKIVYLHTDQKDIDKMKSKSKINPIILGDEWFKKRKINIKEAEILYNCYVNNSPPRDEKLSFVYDEMINDINAIKDKQLHINEGHFEIMPNTSGKRDIIYVCGCSGSGKSTFCMCYINKYLRLFDQNEVYIFSKVENDSSLNLDNDKIHKIVIDKSIIDQPIEVNELDNSLVLFDDVDTIQQKPLLKAMENLKDTICQEGRHTDTYALITSHIYSNYSKTRIIINESTGIVFFLNSGSAYHISRFLKIYVGCDGPTIKKLLNLRSRWVYISLTAPRYVVSEHCIFLL